MCPPVLNPHISAVGVTNLSETFVKPGKVLTPRFERCSVKKPDHGNRLLRACDERPRRRRRAANQRDELAPPQGEHAAFPPAIRWAMTRRTRAGVRPVSRAISLAQGVS